MSNAALKTCNRCKGQKPRADFWGDKYSPDGLCRWCKTCIRLAKSQAQVARKQKRPEAPEGFKYCLRCKLQKPLDLFGSHKGRKDGKNTKCKPCGTAESIEWKKKNSARRSEIVRASNLANKEKRVAATAARRAGKDRRTPAWLTESDFKQMADMYAFAANCQIALGEPYHVDHIFPLHGKFVSGLHVPGNLQILTAEVNIRKSNNWKPE